MPSPAALLSANASLSAMLGGTAGIGSGSIIAATGGTQGTDFSSLLPNATDLVPVSTAKPTLPPSAPAATDADSDTDGFIASGTASGKDQIPASSGKSLPLAALTSAVLPVPITLSALTETAKSPSDTTDDSDQPPAPAIDTSGNDRALALMAMTQTTQPTAASTPVCTSLTPTAATTSPSSATAAEPSFPTLAMAQVQTLSAKGSGSTGQTGRTLPKPGFTLLPDTAIADAGSDLLATAQPAPTTIAAAPQPSITLSAATTAATTIAMADPAQRLATAPQPGFTLLADATPVAGTALPAAQLAITDPDITLKADTSVAMAPAASVAVPVLIVARDQSQSQSQPQGAVTNTAATAVNMAQAQPVAPIADVRPDPAPSIRLASARNSGAQGRIIPASARHGTAPVDTTARPAIDLDAGDAQPGFSAHSPTSPSADGASVLDNAPSLTQPLASAGTAAAAQTLAATGGAATSTFATQQGGTDMAALVDRLVEARAAARSGLSSQIVQASLTHSDFGRVSLRFNADEDGLSVSMASSDPGFAPAAQAALAQAPAVSANAQSHGAGQQGSNQQGSGQPGLHWTQSSAQPALQANTGGQSSMGGSSGQGGQNWAQGGQTSAPASQNTPAAQARAAANAATATSPRNRGGILA